LKQASLPRIVLPGCNNAWRAAASPGALATEWG
jgi:hypothetical protein